MTGNLISRLEALASWLASVTPPYVPPVVTDTDAHKIAADLREAIALLKEAGSALEPFAASAEAAMTLPLAGASLPDGDVVWAHSFSVREIGTRSATGSAVTYSRQLEGKLTVGDFRRASSVSARIREAGGG